MSSSSTSSDQEQQQQQQQVLPPTAYSHDDTLNNVTLINNNHNESNPPNSSSILNTNIINEEEEDEDEDNNDHALEITTNHTSILPPTASSSSDTTTNNNNNNNNAQTTSTDSVLDDEKTNGMDKDGFFSVRLTPLIDHSSSSSGLYFSPIIRKIKPKSGISIGRYTEKNKSAAHAPQGSSAPIVFKSKVVSRTHALFQCNEDGQWFLKDCKSSSGTFLNHIRLSPASQESTLMPLIDGDIIQLGMDYRGGTEEVYRCVKMRCEFNKSWQRKVNQFNLEMHKKLKNLHSTNEINDENIINNDTTNSNSLPLPNSKSGNDLAECAICLMKIEPCQALFISPCSHSWHYKCIRPIIIKSYPQFYCPNCRTMCDLETDLDEDD
ncbi:SMAD/FHA domain-containing protein [Scheffersomyces coipomensis]|uniref:SMAD/FHA domain-containing protein n=1 Tax=Scheffersomyces coipomensis TaxID=1788519 RepID=UPI00315CE7A5